MRWPRGRYNGQRIVGVDVKLVIDVLRWRFYGPSRFTKMFAVGPVRMYFYWKYEDEGPR